VDEEDRRSYQLELTHLVVAEDAANPARVEKTLAHTMNGATPGFDSQGHLVVRAENGEDDVTLGISQKNVLAEDSSDRLAQQLLEARLREELHKGKPPKVSESDVERDWSLLQKVLDNSSNQVANATGKPAQITSQTR
jgi:hypothetical protein